MSGKLENIRLDVCLNVWILNRFSIMRTGDRWRKWGNGGECLQNGFIEQARMGAGGVGGLRTRKEVEELAARNELWDKPGACAYLVFAIDLP